MRTLLLFSLLLLFISCQQEKSKPLKLNCEVVNQLIESDQALRKTVLRSSFFAALDSIVIANGHEGGLEEIDPSSEPRWRQWWEEAKLYEKALTLAEMRVQDSLWKVQWHIDSLNTMHVIQLIETYGIDSLNSIDHQCDQNSLSIFVHTPQPLFDTVRAVVEANKDVIDGNRLRHIDWHLNGRE